MAKNLRQKYKDAKKQLYSLKWQLLRTQSNKMFTEVKAPVHNLRANKVVDMYQLEHMRDAVIKNLAYDLAKHMVDNDLINISETYDPYSGRACVTADIYVVSKHA